jgi:hypothetical protein
MFRAAIADDADRVDERSSVQSSQHDGTHSVLDCVHDVQPRRESGQVRLHHDASDVREPD